MIEVLLLVGVGILALAVWLVGKTFENAFDVAARAVFRKSYRRGLAEARTALVISAPAPPAQVIARVIELVNAHQSAPPVVAGLYLKEQTPSTVCFALGTRLKGDEFVAEVALTAAEHGSVGRFEVLGWLEHGPVVSGTKDMVMLRDRVAQAVHSEGGTANPAHTVRGLGARAASPSELSSNGRGSTRPPATAPAKRKGRGRMAVAFVAGVALVLATVTAFLWWPRTAAADRTTVVLAAHLPSGQPPDKTALATTRDLLARRLEAAGFRDSDVAATATGLVITVADVHSADDFRGLIAPAQVQFRKMIKSTPDMPTTLTSAVAAAAATLTPTGVALPDLQAVLTKLGPAATIAQQIEDPSTLASDTATLAQLEPFRNLSSAEVAALPPETQYNVPQVTCEKLNSRPAESVQDPSQVAVACEDKGHTKMWLDKAKVLGTDLKSADAGIDAAGSAWQVDLVFNGEGTSKWTTLTREAYNNQGGACIDTAQNQQGGGNPVCRIAIVLDNTVVSAPGIQGVLTSTSRITGGFNKEQATLLANQLKYGALPLVLEIASVKSEHQGDD